MNKTDLSTAIIQIDTQHKRSVILTRICTVITNVNLVNFTNKTGVYLLTMTQQDRNTSEWSTGTIYTQ